MWLNGKNPNKDKYVIEMCMAMATAADDAISAINARVSDCDMDNTGLKKRTDSSFFMYDLVQGELRTDIDDVELCLEKLEKKLDMIMNEVKEEVQSRAANSDVEWLKLDEKVSAIAAIATATARSSVARAEKRAEDTDAAIDILTASLQSHIARADIADATLARLVAKDAYNAAFNTLIVSYLTDALLRICVIAVVAFVYFV
jgi:ribosome-associated translation inhibitor RaiA